MGDPLAPIDLRFDRFEIQELDNSQIIRYLGQLPALRRHAREVFDKEIRPFRRVLEIARNPYFLTFLGEELEENPGSRLPDRKAALIQRFIERAIRDQGSGGGASGHFDGLDLPAINHVLAEVAARELDRFAKPGDRGLVRFPHEVKDLDSASFPVRAVLQFGEACGVLRQSGVLRAEEAPWGEIVFAHDYFRDYFAAMHMRVLGGEDFINTLADRVELFGWDGAWEMFFDLNPDPGLSGAALEKIAVLDWGLAANCAGATRNLSAQTLAQVLEKAKPGQPVEKDVPYVWWHAPDSSRPLLRRALKSLSTDTLLRLLDEEPQWPDWQQDVIDEFTSRKQGEALPSLAEWYESASFYHRIHILSSAAKIPSSEALDFVLTRYASLELDESMKSFICRWHVLSQIAYRPSVSEALALARQYGEECLRFLLSNIEEISEAECDILRPYVSSTDQMLREEVARLLLNAGDASWQEAIHSLDSPICKGLANGEIKQDAVAADSFIISLAKKTAGAPFSNGERALLLLVKCRTEKAFEWIARRACVSLNKRVSDWSFGPLLRPIDQARDLRFQMRCLKALEEWPGIESRLERVESFTEPCDKEQTTLTLACLGKPGLQTQVREIFDRLCDRLVGRAPYPQLSFDKVEIELFLKAAGRALQKEDEPRGAPASNRGGHEPQNSISEVMLEDQKRRCRRDWLILPLAVHACYRLRIREVVAGMEEVAPAIYPHLNAACEDVIARAAFAPSDFADVAYYALCLLIEYDPPDSYVSEAAEQALNTILARVPPEKAVAVWRLVFRVWKLQMDWPGCTETNRLRRFLAALARTLPERDADLLMSKLCPLCVWEAIPQAFQKEVHELAYEMGRARGRRYLEIFGSWPPERVE